MDDEEYHDQTIVKLIPKLDRKEKQAYIIFLSGPLVGKIHLLEEGAVTIGRSPQASIPVNDNGISRTHLRFEYHEGKTIAKDLGSTNGTFLNGQRVEEAELHDGDKLQLSPATIIKYSYQDKIENIFHNELYRMAVIDALTGIHNKRFFEERIKEEFSYAVRNSSPLSLLMFDIDHFKKINDTYGHPGGDYVLGKLSSLAQSIMRKEDLLARCGGEEFAAILRSTDTAGAVTIAERLRKLIEDFPFEFDGKRIAVTISVGVATLSGKNHPDPEALIKAADALLYKSKESGRNRVSA